MPNRKVKIRRQRIGVAGGGPVCDFCISPNRRWRYRTSRFHLPAEDGFQSYTDDGEWAACDSCKDDMEAGAFDAIDARRFLNMLATLRPGEVLDLDFGQRWAMRLREAFLAHKLEGPIADG